MPRLKPWLTYGAGGSIFTGKTAHGELALVRRRFWVSLSFVVRDGKAEALAYLGVGDEIWRLT
jgi:hypothetical protein